MDEKLIPKIDFNEYSKDKYLLDLGNYEIKEENGKIFAVLKKPKYPTNYEQCCNYLGLQHCGLTIDLPLNYSPLFIYFAQLYICRNAYWKIAGEELGLNKSWEPDWNDHNQPKFGIHNIQNNIHLITLHVLKNLILVFPTEEMRYVFYENFKDLIEICKEFL